MTEIEITLWEKRAALEFERGVWQRWAKQEISTEAACRELNRYLDELRARAAERAKK